MGVKIHQTQHPRIGVFAGVTDVHTRTGEEQLVAVIVTVHSPGEHQVAMVVQALNALRFGFGFEKGRHHQAREDANDGNHHE